MSWPSGQFTIPLMKRFGFRSRLRRRRRGDSSMGGQIMPPVMGAVAFIMAETLDVPYSKIVKAAIIPALLYFGSASGWCIWKPAKRAARHAKRSCRAR
jgi:TRAP-type uncharacterized transport system fused permease subunit